MFFFFLRSVCTYKLSSWCTKLLCGPVLFPSSCRLLTSLPTPLTWAPSFDLSCTAAGNKSPLQIIFSSAFYLEYRTEPGSDVRCIRDYGDQNLCKLWIKPLKQISHFSNLKAVKLIPILNRNSLLVFPHFSRQLRDEAVGKFDVGIFDSNYVTWR